MDIINTANFEERIRELMTEWHIPGLSIAVFNEKDIIGRGFGLASLEPEVATTSDTLYDVASTSKSVTAGAVGKLLADKETYPHITWTTPVSQLLKDDFVLQDATSTASVTIEDILSHRSGMPRHDWSYMGIKARNPDNAESITRNLRNLCLSAPLRTKYQYCNMMFTVAAYLVEKESSQPFDKFLQSNIFDPLNMKSSYLQPSAVIAAKQEFRLSVPYAWRSNLNRYEKRDNKEQPEAIGAGSIQTSATDYAKWVQAVMTKNSALFDAETYDELVKPRIISDPEDKDDELRPFTSNEMYALGWDVGFYRGYRIVGHDGSETGYSACMFFLPSKNFGMTIFANVASAGDILNVIAKEIVDHVLNIPSEDRVDWNQRAKVEKEKEQEYEEKSRKEVLGENEPAPNDLTLPLESFTGTYNNLGYKDMTVDIKDGQLHIDAMDRSMEFEISLEHVKDNRIFLGKLTDDDFDISYIRAEFEVEGEAVRKLGLGLCWEIKPKLIWFEKRS